MRCSMLFTGLINIGCVKVGIKYVREHLIESWIDFCKPHTICIAVAIAAEASGYYLIRHHSCARIAGVKVSVLSPSINLYPGLEETVHLFLVQVLLHFPASPLILLGEQRNAESANEPPH